MCTMASANLMLASASQMLKARQASKTIMDSGGRSVQEWSPPLGTLPGLPESLAASSSHRKSYLFVASRGCYED